MITIATLKAIVPVTMLVLAVIGIFYYFGEREPLVVVHDRGMQVKCLFGRSIAFAEITGVYLLGQSMKELGIGQISFGYGMKSCKGNFQAGLLYVWPEAAPTLLIERGGQSNVYISFRDRESTETLYEALISRCHIEPKEESYET